MEGEQDRQATYLAYMLRLWQAGNRDGKPVWRVSLENPHTGERQAFGDVDALFTFLADRTASMGETRGLAETPQTAAGDIPAR